MDIIIHDGQSTRTVTAQEGQTLLVVLQDAGVPISAACGGNGTCGKCKVMVHQVDDDLHGYEEVLACCTQAAEGLEVMVEKHSLLVEESGTTDHVLEHDEGRTGYGLAIDVGTTTLACYLHNLETGERLASGGLANPQAVFGADVISRIEASVAGRLPQLCQTLATGISSLIDDVCKAKRVKRDQLVDAALVGNTTMQHFVTGLAPDTIGVTPFTPLSYFGGVEQVEGTGLPTYLAPCVSGYVGGDITAGLLVSGVPDADHPRIFVDVGTNGEMALGCSERLICCATAAGPAFEGAGIRFGMPASEGAISRVQIGEEGDLAFQTIGDIPLEEATGICGSALIDIIACLLKTGAVDESGYLLDEDEFLDQDEGTYQALAHRLVEFEDQNAVQLTDKVYLVSRDIRNVQLAKAAVHAGIDTMLDAYGIGVDEVEALVLAGGFGSHIDLESAATIGLFPPELLDRAYAIGNAAGEGAAALLLSSKERERIAGLKERLEYLELSTTAAFNSFYVDAMAFE